MKDHCRQKSCRKLCGRAACNLLITRFLCDMATTWPLQGMAACAACPSTIVTSPLGAYFNACLAKIGKHVVFTSNADAPSATKRSRNCSAEHQIEVRRALPEAAKCGSEMGRRRTQLLLSMAGRERVCQDVLNFRANGPEDARLLPLTHRQALIIFVDFAESVAAFPALPYHRQMHVRTLYVDDDITEHALSSAGPASSLPRAVPSSLPRAVPSSLLRASLGPVQHLQPSSPALLNLSAIEKNWVPFTVATSARHSHGDEHSSPISAPIYLQQWLDDGHGRTVTLQLDLRTGVLLDRWDTPPIRDAIGKGGELR